MHDPEVTVELAIQHGLSTEEYDRVVRILGRTPSYTELGMFSVMWSEHCSYKNSIAELKKLPRKGGRLLVDAGEENAGLVDIGDGLAVAFKIESHNHPSAVEPYQGAATGVGGIMRDIFTMGARPIAALNSLRFGNPSLPRTQYLLKGIVKGIGDYGNSFGVPTIAGDVFFDDCYNDNPLVNAMAVGIVKHSEIAKAISYGEGNIVMIVGSSTGRDGIHGATFASSEISEESESKRPSVQVGDPFTEKILLEATLEVIKSGYLIGIQDMGAAGITCSTCEMSAKGRSGMSIDLDKVPVREQGMSGYEIMLSESQERMLLVATPENAESVRSIFSKWDLMCQPIGRVIADGRIKVSYRGKTIADVPAESLVLGGGAPVYLRESRQPLSWTDRKQFNQSTIPELVDYNEALLRLLHSPNICSRRWIVTQYDSMVRTNTLVDIIGDAAVVRIKGTSKALGIKTDCNPRYVHLNPYRGATIAVAESARNVVCVGARPIAITNCLNFGNPYKPESYWQFQEVIRGIADACEVLGTPVTGGNVSFYNESPMGAIYPTPVIGMLGEILDISTTMSADFKNPNDLIILLGENPVHLGGSEFLKLQHGKVLGDAPPIDLQFEKRLQDACLELIQQRLIHSAHDISEGGLAVTLAECCIFAAQKNFHVGVSIDPPNIERMDYFLFGEDQSRIVISISEDSLLDAQEICGRFGIPVNIIGRTSLQEFRIGGVIDLRVEELINAFEGSFAAIGEQSSRSA